MKSMRLSALSAFIFVLSCQEQVLSPAESNKQLFNNTAAIPQPIPLQLNPINPDKPSPSTTHTTVECQNYHQVFLNKIFLLSLRRLPTALESQIYGSVTLQTSDLINELLGPYNNPDNAYRVAFNRRVVDDVYLLLLDRFAESDAVRDMYFGQYEEYGYFTANNNDFSKAGIVYAISGSQEFRNTKCASIGVNSSLCDQIRNTWRTEHHFRSQTIKMLWAEAYGQIPPMNHPDVIALVNVWNNNPYDQLRQVLRHLVSSPRFEQYLKASLHKPAGCKE